MSWRLTHHAPTWALHSWHFLHEELGIRVVLNFGCSSREWFTPSEADAHYVSDLISLVPEDQKAMALAHAIAIRHEVYDE